MKYNRDEYHPWRGVDWSKSYSAHRKPMRVSPMREWVMAFSIVALLVGTLAAAFVR